MSKVYFTADIHFGHENLRKFSPTRGTDEEFIDSWNSVVQKRDTVWVLGDVAMTRPGTAYNNSTASRLRALANTANIANTAALANTANTAALANIFKILKYNVPVYNEVLALVGKLKGNKKLILGNHDELPIEFYKQYFSEIKGFARYKGFWLSHAPIHPDELRGKRNIHGHVHQNTLADDRYINVSVEENLKRNGTVLVSLADL